MKFYITLILCLLGGCATLLQAASFDPPPLKLEPLARFSVDLVAPIW